MKIAIFCGSSSGNHPEYLAKTQALGQFLATQNIDIVYGGGKVGLMGAIADSVLENGGKAYGVMPKDLVDKEIAHPALTDLSVVASMHERKAKMAAMADAFISLPGGAGTLEEIFEAWTWAQLGHHTKPCAFYNIGGYYEPLIMMVERMVDAGFLNNQYAEMLITCDTPDSVLSSFKSYSPPKQKWT